MMHLINIVVLTLAWSSMQCNAAQVPSEWEVEFIQNFAERRADDENELNRGTTPQGYSGTPIIYPGTKWCGPGDISANDDDLGEEVETDKCCRAHDKCDDTIAPGKSKDGLENDSTYTKLSCPCDRDFYTCLSKVNTSTSGQIRYLYFYLFKRECYEEDYPLTDKCIRKGIFWGCNEYEKDTTKPKVLQWASPIRTRQS